MTGVMLWAIICALIWWEAEKHAGFPRENATLWAAVCFFLGPLGVLLYIVLGRIMGPSAEELQERQRLKREAASAVAANPYKPPPVGGKHQVTPAAGVGLQVFAILPLLVGGLGCLIALLAFINPGAKLSLTMHALWGAPLLYLGIWMLRQGRKAIVR